MDLFTLSLSACGLCIVLVLSLRYLSLLRWFSGQAYVLSKKQERFTVLEVLELFKNAKPFPVAYQKGWKINSFVHGHRVWFHFLTFTQSSTAPCIKVYAAFDKISSSAQSILQLIKDASLSCEWKPGVIAASSVHDVTSLETNGRTKGIPSMPVQHDFVREERVQSTRHRWLTGPSSTASIVTPTVIEDYKRFWHKEDNGCSWLLQMNEVTQSLVFYLIQPVQDVDHCLLTVVTWSTPHAACIIPVEEKPSILLSSLKEYIHLRRVQMTPLLNISLPHRMPASSTLPPLYSLSVNSPGTQGWFQMPLVSRIRRFLGYQTNSGSADVAVEPDNIKKSASILHYKSSEGSLQLKTGHLNHEPSPPIKEEAETDSNSDSADIKDLPASTASGDSLHGQDETATNQSGVLRSLSDGTTRHSPSPSLNLSPWTIESEKTIARYKTMVNQAAAELMAEALKASNIDLEKSPDIQAESSDGWMFLEFVNNIVVLRKVPVPGSSVQSYLGKGFVLAPPKTVWDAVRNPRTRFTYDESLKKVDILDNITDGIKIVYLYQEVLQLLRKDCCDVCCLQGERIEGSKYVLAYASVSHPSAPAIENVLRGQMLSSGWIIEPVRKDSKVYSLVTYLMQMDFGPPRSSMERLPMEDMMSRQPMSISFLQQYLKPAVQLARRKSAPVIPIS